jgi:hypothetical protein
MRRRCQNKNGQQAAPPLRSAVARVFSLRAILP